MKNKIITGFILLSMLVVVFSSCYKKFDPASYAPAFTMNGYTSSAEIAKSNLVAYWAFNGGYTDSVSGLSASPVGTSFAEGLKGQALQGANNGYAISDLPTAVRNLKSFTIAFWLKTGNTVNLITPICISRTDQFWGALDMFYENSGRTDATANFKIHINAQSEVWFTTPWISNPWSGWVNIALTYDAATSKFTAYQGGSQIATTTSAGLGDLVFPATATKIIFGTEQFQCTPAIGTAGAQSWAGYLQGLIDEVRVYNKALTSDELSTLAILQGKGR